MDFDSLLEIIRDFNSNITVSDLLDSGLVFDNLADCTYNHIIETLKEHFTEE